MTANYDDNGLGVLLGNGAGRFRAKRDFAAGLHPVAVVVADVDLDGRPDLVSANQSGAGTLSVLINDGR